MLPLRPRLPGLNAILAAGKKMAFSVGDFQDLLRLLEQRPEWRAELRRQILPEELLTLPDLVRELTEAQRYTDVRLDQLAQRIGELADAQKRTEARIGELAQQMGVLADRLGAMTDRVGAIERELLEARYERRAPAYFGKLARKLRLVDRSRLADMLDDAIDAGSLSSDEREAILAADLVLSGQRREDRLDVYYVVEISKGIGSDDVVRAVDRAGILSKLGRPAVPIVAGEWLTEDAKQAARDMHVEGILDGRRRRTPDDWPTGVERP